MPTASVMQSAVLGAHSLPHKERLKSSYPASLHELPVSARHCVDESKTHAKERWGGGVREGSGVLS